jgi:hypothetical protein
MAAGLMMSTSCFFSFCFFPEVLGRPFPFFPLPDFQRQAKTWGEDYYRLCDSFLPSFLSSFLPSFLPSFLLSPFLSLSLSFFLSFFLLFYLFIYLSIYLFIYLFIFDTGIKGMHHQGLLEAAFHIFLVTLKGNKSLTGGRRRTQTVPTNTFTCSI